MRLFIFYLLVFLLIIITKSQDVDQTIILYKNLSLLSSDIKYHFDVEQNNNIKYENQMQFSPIINKLIVEKKICLISNTFCLVSITLSVDWDVIQKLFQESCIPILNSTQVTIIEEKTKNDFFVKGIILREIFSENANCATIANEIMFKNFDISQMLFYGKKVLDERVLLKDASVMNSKNSLITTVPLYDEDKKLFSKSKFVGKSRSDLFTVIILTYRRISCLKKIIRNLGSNSKIDKIVVIWNDQKLNNIPKKSYWPNSKKPLYFVKTKKNSLNNRFLPLDIITTDGILSIDDDQVVNNALLNKAFKIWQTNNDTLVGHYTRRTFNNKKIGYFTKKYKSFDLILTGLAFIHRKYLIKYTNEINSKVKNYIDKNMNCEDIAMNFLIADMSKKPNVFFDMKDEFNQHLSCTKGLSGRKNHYRKRETCIKYLINIYGKNPMKRSSTCLTLNDKKC